MTGGVFAIRLGCSFVACATVMASKEQAAMSRGVPPCRLFGKIAIIAIFYETGLGNSSQLTGRSQAYFGYVPLLHGDMGLACRDTGRILVPGPSGSGLQSERPFSEGGKASLGDTDGAGRLYRVEEFAVTPSIFCEMSGM
ncbi:hypothetical protein [Rhizobium sp.]